MKLLIHVLWLIRSYGEGGNNSVKRNRPYLRAVGCSSVGKLVQHAETVQDLLEAADKLWLPTDPGLAPHLTQRIHQEKRLRWSSQLIEKMGILAVRQKQGGPDLVWEDARMERAVMAAAIPCQTDTMEKEGRYLKEALCGLHNLIGSGSFVGDINRNVLTSIRTMFHRIDSLGHQVSLPDAVELKWACCGITSRLDTSHVDDLQLHLPPSLDTRTSLIPFDILPASLDWEQTLPNPLSNLQREIPFSFDTIVTRRGASVTERRGTAWIAEDGIGSLAYSGKLMTPNPISPMIREIMRLVESRVLTNQDDGECPRPFFDCALCNFYPNTESACKFHTDPEHGEQP